MIDIPAWKIMELLNDDELANYRKRDNTEIEMRKRDSAIPDSSGEA